MRIGIISDIHGNLEALNVAIPFLKDRTDILVCLGDTVGYGPDPEECVRTILEKSTLVLKGNHEEGIITGDMEKFKQTARVSLEWTRSMLSAEILTTLRNLPDKDIKEDILFVHASVSSPLFRYVMRKEDAEEEMQILIQTVCFIGHTHIPGGFLMEMNTGKVDVICPDFSGKMDIELKDGFKYFINVGSVGQPRDGFPFACASVYDTDSRHFVLHRLKYPAEVTSKKIIERGIPSVLARRIIQAI